MKESLSSFVNDRLAKGVKFSDSIKRNNIPTFATVTKTSSKMVLSANRVTIADRELFSRLVVIAQIRKFILKELFQYELANIPLSIATSDGSLRKTQNASLLQEIEELSSEGNTDNHDYRQE